MHNLLSRLATRGLRWCFWLGVVAWASLALWTNRAEAMPPALAAAAGVVALVAAEPAVAQAAPAAAPPAGQQAGKVLSRAMNGIQAAGARMAGALWNEGYSLFWLVWTLMLGWTTYKNYHQSEDLVGALSLFGASSMFIFLVMMLYMPPRAGVGTWAGSPVYMAQIFTGGFEDYAKKIAANSGIAAMGANWNSMQAVGAKLFWNSIRELLEYAAGLHMLPEKPDMLDYLKALAIGLPRFLHVGLALIASIIVGIAMVVYIFVVLMADVLVAVGLTLGPIMIPFYLMPVLSFLFDGWLRFMITAGFYKLVATVMLALTYNLVKELAFTSKALATGGVWWGDLMSLSLAVVIAVITLLLMWQVPSIASALTQGSAGGDMNQALRAMKSLQGLKATGKKS